MPVHALEVPTPLADRRSAGKLLAEGLESLAIDSPVVIGLARGGVPVAYEIAMYCGAPLDVLPVCRITAPDSTVTIGALADGADPLFEIDKTQVRRLGVSQQWIADQVELHLESLERCRGLWRGTGISLQLRGRTLIVVDDSLATGCTARAALMSLARNHQIWLVGRSQQATERLSQCIHILTADRTPIQVRSIFSKVYRERMRGIRYVGQVVMYNGRHITTHDTINRLLLRTGIRIVGELEGNHLHVRVE